MVYVGITIMYGELGVLDVWMSRGLEGRCSCLEWEILVAED